MHVCLFACSARWSTAAAVVLLFPALAAAGLKDRPAQVLCPPDEYLCPFGLAQWMGQQHRFVYGDGADAEEETPVAEHPPVREALEAPAPPARDEGPCEPDFGCPFFGRPIHQDYSDVEDTLPDREAEEGVSLVDASPDPRQSHSMGQRYAIHLNMQQDGVDDELDAKLEWSEPFLPVHVPVPPEPGHETPEDAQEECYPLCDEESFLPKPEEDDAEGTDIEPQEGDDRQASYFSELGLRISTAVTDAITCVVDTLKRLADEVEAGEASEDVWSAPLPAQKLEPHDFIPAFGSPYDGDL